MSRVGAKIVNFNDDIKINFENNGVSISGKLGILNIPIPNFLSVVTSKENGNCLWIKLKEDISLANLSKSQKSFWGLTRSIVYNAIVGVSDGFTKRIEMVGVGYSAVLEKNVIVMYTGYSHYSAFVLPEGMSVRIDGNFIYLTHIDKCILGMAVASIKNIRPTESYKGKGIRAEGDLIVLKEVKK